MAPLHHVLKVFFLISGLRSSHATCGSIKPNRKPRAAISDEEKLEKKASHAPRAAVARQRVAIIHASVVQKRRTDYRVSN